MWAGGIFLLLIEVVRIAATPPRSSLQRQTIGSIIRASAMSQLNVGSDLKRKALRRHDIGALHHNARLWAACHHRALPWCGRWHVSGLIQRAHCLTLERCISVAWAPLSTLISHATRVDLRPFGWIKREPVGQCEMGNEPVCPDFLRWLLMWVGINGLFRAEISESDQWDGRRGERQSGDLSPHRPQLLFPVTQIWGMKRKLQMLCWCPSPFIA